MTDAEQRRRRRRAVSGDPRAEAAWLRARVRAGELSADRMRLAAYLGHAPAAMSVGEEVRQPGELRGWVRGLGRFSKEACVRAAVAAARVVIRPEEAYDYPGQALRAAEGWVDCPCRTCADLAEQAIGDVQIAVTRRERSAVEAARAAAGVVRPPQEPQYRNVFSTTRRASRAARCAASSVGEERVREAIRAALIPWALDAEAPPPGLEQRTGLTRPRPTPERALRASSRRGARTTVSAFEAAPDSTPWHENDAFLLLVGLGAAAVRALLDVMG